jgi:uncharacterized protein
MRYLFITLSIVLPIKLFGADLKIDTIIMKSSILSGDRTILVYTPEGFKSTDSVSIVYMPDGEYAKNRFEHIAHQQNRQIIGIGIITDRRVDLLPNNRADKFNEFVVNELFNKIEADYKIKERILYGHSFGGAFTIYSMINSPSQFNKYIASSPTPIMNMIDGDLYRQLNDNLQTETKFYISFGSKDMRQVKKWASRLIDNLSNSKLDKLHWTSEVFKGENHNTSDKFSIVNGILF